MTASRSGFWEEAEQVEKFAGRDPDLRLRELLDDRDDPGSLRVLDLGCAGGRNTVLLARWGCDVWAVDASSAMVEETRRRVSRHLGPAEARRRVRTGRMTALDAFPHGTFGLVVALGIFHNAGSRMEWDRALSEAARVLEAEGRLLVATFAPGTHLTGDGMARVPGTRHVYRGAPSGPLYLVTAEELDRAMADRGLRPLEPTETVEVETEGGRRVTVNGLYEKLPPATPRRRRSSGVARADHRDGSDRVVSAPRRPRSSPSSPPLHEECRCTGRCP